MKIALSLLAITLLSSTVYAAPGASLAEAAKRNDKTVVRSLLKKKVDVNAPLGDGTTALHWAAYHEDLSLVQELLKSGASPKVASRVGAITPLSLAATNGNTAIVTALLKAGADPNVASTNGTTALMVAATSGNKETVLALLNAGADPNARESVHGQTALMFAATKNRAGVIRVLLNRGADAKATSNVSQLTRPTVDEDGNPIQPRRNTAESDAPATPTATAPAREGRGGGGNAPTRTFGGNTALTLAAREGHLAAIKALLEIGADIDQPNAGDKTTPLITAISNGHFDVAKFLLDRGADPNLASVDGLTPLYAAIDTQWAPVGWAPNPITGQEKTTYLDLMEALLKKEADPNARLIRRLWFRPTHHNELWINPAGSTAFWRSAQATDIEAMRLLLAHKADPKIATNDGDNALMVAAGIGWNGNFSVQGPDSALDTVKFCLELGLDPTPQDTQGYSAVFGAAYRGDNELVKLLVGKGAKLDVRTTRGWSVTDMANGPSLRSSVPVKHPDTIALLRKLGAPELTPTDKEEILGIIRPRPQAPPTQETPPTQPKTENPQ